MQKRVLLRRHTRAHLFLQSPLAVRRAFPRNTKSSSSRAKSGRRNARLFFLRVRVANFGVSGNCSHRRETECQSCVLVLSTRFFALTIHLSLSFSLRKQQCTNSRKRCLNTASGISSPKRTGNEARARVNFLQPFGRSRKYSRKRTGELDSARMGF